MFWKCTTPVNDIRLAHDSWDSEMFRLYHSNRKWLTVAYSIYKRFVFFMVLITFLRDESFHMYIYPEYWNNFTTLEDFFEIIFFRFLSNIFQLLFQISLQLQKRWLNEYNARIRTLVGEELKLQFNMQAFYWMMNKTMHVIEYYPESEYRLRGDSDSIRITPWICIVALILLLLP